MLSFIAAALTITAYQMRDNKRLFLLKGISGALFSLSYFLFGNVTAGALNMVNLLRGSVLAGGDKWHKWPWLLLIQALYVGGCVVTFGKSEVLIGGAVFVMVISLISTFSQLAETQILWGRNGKHIRIAQLAFISPVWLFNNIITGSIGGIITEIFGITSVIVSIARYGINGFEVQKNK